MTIYQYQVDALASRPFEGNPAAVCPLRSWLDDRLLQAIAEENNLSETAFFVPTLRDFALRGFTPVREVDLCGHATAPVIFNIRGYLKQTVIFETRSGDLTVARQDNGLEMDFPLRSCAVPLRRAVAAFLHLATTVGRFVPPYEWCRVAPHEVQRAYFCA